MRPIILFLIFLLIPHINAYAAYVGNPSRIFKSGGEEKPYSIYAEGITDIVYDRGGKHQADDMKVDFYGGAAGLIYKNRYVLYGGAGTAKVEEVYTVLEQEVKWESDYNFTWLTGCVFKVCEKNLKNFYNSRFLLSLDTQYRNTDTDPDTISIGSVEYDTSHPQINHSSMEYNDWHVALTCGLDMGMFSPYAGIKYSDFESCVRVTRDATVYQKDNAEADDNYGIFIGAGVKILDSLYANIEAGFIDEDYFSVSASWRF